MEGHIDCEDDTENEDDDGKDDIDDNGMATTI